MWGRTTEESSKRAADEPEIEDVGGVQQSPRPSFIAADREHDAESFDSVAGSEFVDDRIRSPTD